MSERADVFFTLIESPIGTLYAAATAEGICLLEFDGKERRKRQLAALSRRYGSVARGENAHLALLRRELDAYYAGRLRRFTVPLVLHGMVVRAVDMHPMPGHDSPCFWLVTSTGR